MLDVPYFETLLLFFDWFFSIIIVLLICYDIHIEMRINFKDFFDTIFYAFICIILFAIEGEHILISIFSEVFLIFLGPLGLLIFYLVIVIIIIVLIVRIRRHKKV